MAYFKIKGEKRDRWIVQAADEAAALVAVMPVFSGVNPDIEDYPADFSLYDKTLLFTWIFYADQNGIDYFVSDNTQSAAIAKFNAAFSPGITISRIVLKKPYIKLDLIAGIASFKKPYYVNTHHNGSNSDYTLATQDADIALVKYYNFNGVRNDYNANFQSSTFDPVDGNTSNAFFKFAAKLATNNLELLPVISSSHAIFTPASPSANYTNGLDSSGIAMAEYTARFNKIKSDAIYFNNRLKATGVVCRIQEVGSENDVIQQSTKLLSGSGVKPIPPYQLDADGTPYWTSSYSNGLMQWPAKNFGMLLYGLAGWITGTLTVFPDMEFIYDHSERHYGQSYAISRDLKKLHPSIADRLTITAPHNYSDHENGTDITGTFIKKKATDPGTFFNTTVAPDGVKMAHSNIDRTYFFLINPTETTYKKMFISECGYNVDKNGPPDGTNPLLFMQNYLMPYQNDPNNLGIAYFMLKNEPISRADSANAEKHFGINDYQPLADYLHGYKPPNT